VLTDSPLSIAEGALTLSAAELRSDGSSVPLTVESGGSATLVGTVFQSTTGDITTVTVAVGGSFTVSNSQLIHGEIIDPFPCIGADLACAGPHAGSVMVAGPASINTAAPLVCADESASSCLSGYTDMPSCLADIARGMESCFVYLQRDAEVLNTLTVESGENFEIHGNRGEPKLQIQADFVVDGALVLADLRVVGYTSDLPGFAGFSGSYNLTGCDAVDIYSDDTCENCETCGIYTYVEASCIDGSYCDVGSPTTCGGAPVYQNNAPYGGNGRVLYRHISGDDSKWWVAPSDHLTGCHAGTNAYARRDSNPGHQPAPPDDNVTYTGWAQPQNHENPAMAIVRTDHRLVTLTVLPDGDLALLRVEVQYGTLTFAGTVSFTDCTLTSTRLLSTTASAVLNVHGGTLLGSFVDVVSGSATIGGLSRLVNSPVRIAGAVEALGVLTLSQIELHSDGTSVPLMVEASGHVVATEAIFQSTAGDITVVTVAARWASRS
jgi:hypothetical protein